MIAKHHVLIPDGNSTWALSVITCLSQNPDYKLFVLSDKKRTAAKYSKHIFYFKFYNRSSDKEWLDLIIKEIEANSISVIVPIAEDEFRFLIENKHLLPNAVNIISLPSVDDFEIAINKHKLSRFLNAHHLPHPKYKYYANLEAYSQEDFGLNFPVIIKPLDEKGGYGIVKFETTEELNLYLTAFSNSSEFFLQEYIEGYDIDCSVLCLNGKVLAHTIQKGKLEGDNAFAPQLFFDFLNNKEILDVVTQLMNALNWSGVAHIDLRYDESTNDYKIIEINARFWGSIEGSKFAGINFPDLAIQLATTNTIADTVYKEIEYMRLKGVIKMIKRKPSFLFKRNYLLNHTETKSFLKDPIPTFYRFIEWLGRRL